MMTTGFPASVVTLVIVEMKNPPSVSALSLSDNASGLRASITSTT
jgi:hypothetical protein